MPTLNIEGIDKPVTVDDSFLKLDAYEQQKIANDIAAQYQASKVESVSKDIKSAPQSGDDLAYRSAVLPLGKTKEGKIVPALPQALYDAANVTKQLMTGQRAPADVTPKEALEMGSIGLAAPPAVKAGAGTISAVRDLAAIEKPKIPGSTAELKSSSQAAYQRVEQAGVKIKPESLRQMVSDIIPDIKKAGFDKDIQPETAAALRRLQSEIELGSAPTLPELDILRQVAGAAARSQNANDRRVARIITGKMDDFLDGLTDKDLLGGETKSKEAVASLKQARDLWRRQAKSGEIDEMLEKAANNAPGTPVLGLEGQLRNQFKALANNPKRMRRFSPDEQDAIKSIARGANLQNALSALGKFSPASGFFGGVLSGAIGLEAFSRPEVLAIPALGALAKYAAGKVRASQVSRFREMVRGGQPASDFFNEKSSARRGLLGGESVFSP